MADVARSDAQAANRRGMMIVISSPSGAGKSTITRYLLENDRGLKLSVSVTTRARRPSEIDGVHYHFIDSGEFERMKITDALLESAHVHGNSYGTPRQAIEEALEAGQDILIDIDWQGAAQLQEKMADDIVSIFILPPSIQELRRRLYRRAEDSEAVIDLRLANAREEMKHWVDYDYVIVNDDLEQAYCGMRSIIRAERLKRVRRKDIAGIIASLTDDGRAGHGKKDA